MAVTLPYIQGSDDSFNRFQVALSKALFPLTSFPTTGSTILTGITITSGSVNNIPHKLNRNIVGWYPIRVRAQSDVWDTQDVNPTPTQTLYLNSSATVVVDIVVF